MKLFFIITTKLLLLLVASFPINKVSGATASSSDSNNDDNRQQPEQTDINYEEGGLRWCNLGASLNSCPLTTAAMLDKYSNITTTSADIDNSNHCLEDSSWLLHPTTGNVPRGSLCGIIGPSGAGKTTFLNALGGATIQSSHISVTGTIYYYENEGGELESKIMKLSQQKGQIAYLSQHDNFFAMLTPRETLEFAAALQQNNNQNRQFDNDKELVERKLSSLGLLHVADRRIGDRTRLDGGGGGGGSSFGLRKVTNGKRRTGASSGLSGGERRRLSVALELMTEPKIMLCDEPTTGLDSAQAGKVVNLISKLAKERKIPVICTLHQPKSSIWKMLDSFILLAPGGKMCYAGSREGAIAYFKDIGYKCPHDTNPAEFFIDLVTIDTDDLDQGKKDVARINFLHHRFLESCTTYANDEQICLNKQQLTMSSKEIGKGERKVQSISRMLHRFGALFQRSMRQNVRNTRVLMLRLGAAVTQAKLFATIFKSVRHDKSLTRSIADRVALLSYGVINLSIMALMKTLDLFARERGVVIREQMRSNYSSLEYLLAKVLAEIPLDASFSLIFASVLKKLTGLRSSMTTLMKTYCLMTVCSVSLGFAIGSMASTVETAMSMGIPLMVVFMVVGIINPSGVAITDDPPNRVMEWIKMGSPIKWAIEALVTAEFRGMVFDKDRDFWGNLKDLPRMGGLAMVRDGNEVLDALGLGNAIYYEIMKKLALLSGVYLLFSWMGLVYGGTKFQST